MTSKIAAFIAGSLLMLGVGVALGSMLHPNDSAREAGLRSLPRATITPPLPQATSNTIELDIRTLPQATIKGCGEEDGYEIDYQHQAVVITCIIP